VPKDVLIAWAVSTGHGKKSVRRILNQLLRELGEGQRRPGAGRKTPPQADFIIALVRIHFGEEGDRFLHAASRAVKTQTAAQRAQARAALNRPELRPSAPAQDQILLLPAQDIQDPIGSGAAVAGAQIPHLRPIYEN